MVLRIMWVGGFKNCQKYTYVIKVWPLMPHVADGLPQPLRNARKLGVNFFETLLPGEHKMGLKKKFHRRKFF